MLTTKTLTLTPDEFGLWQTTSWFRDQIMACVADMAHSRGFRRASLRAPDGSSLLEFAVPT